MATSIPHTENDIEQMLGDLGLTSVDQLFSQIPETVRLAGGVEIDAGISEFDVLDSMSDLAQKNLHDGEPYICFAGGGAYDHDIPSLTSKLTFRSEFVTAYTPYQPEVSQGVLQALFEYQTFVSRLFGLPIANASLYDGATALVEAINVALGPSETRNVAISAGVNPIWTQVAQTYGHGTHTSFTNIDLQNGSTNFAGLPNEVEAVVVQYPNYYGYIEDLEAARAEADKRGAVLIVVADPVSLGVLKSPGEFGADIVIGEGQVFGTPLSFGGPFVGMIAVSEKFTRRLPGRLVGQTVDADGRRAFVTTLRTREQDIRREKATSNICTNQTLIAVAAAIQLSWLGSLGFRELAARCYSAAHYLSKQLAERAGIQLVGGDFVREFSILVPGDADEVIDAMLKHGYLAGIAGEFDGKQCLTLTATEKHTKAQIDQFVELLAKELVK